MNIATIILIILSLFIGFYAHYRIQNQKVKQEIELVCEEIIDKETGIKIDFEDNKPTKA